MTERIGSNFGTGELQGFNVQYTRRDGTQVDRTREGGLTRAIRANDFANLQDAIDVAEAHQGSEAIVRDQATGHFHLAHVTGAGANAIAFSNLDSFTPEQRAQALAVRAEHGGRVDDFDLEGVRQALLTNPSPGLISAAQRLDAAVHSGRGGRSEAARELHNAVQESRVLPGSQVRGGHYADPHRMLDGLRQRDSLGDTISDADRCGAAATVGAAIISGPDAVQQLAQRYHVTLDAQHLTAASAHVLMEEIYLQTQSGRSVQPGVQGLGSNEVNALMLQAAAPQIAGDRSAATLASMSPVRHARPADIQWSDLPPNRPIGVLIRPTPTADINHFVTASRDSQGRFHVYDPDPTSGGCSLTFQNEQEMSTWMQAHAMANGQVELAGASPIAGLTRRH